MEKNNNKISDFQFASIAFFLLTALFTGIGISNTFVLNEQDSWLVSILSLILSIFPLLIFLYLINYKPNKNIFEKNIDLFGKIIGNFINFILAMFAFLLLVIVTTSTTVFAITMYLTKTPYIVIAGIFIAIATYAVIKGIETISRLSEILFFISAIIILIIVFSLFQNFHFDDLKPILSKGYSPLIKNSFIYLSYTLTPVIFLSVIPKENIVNNKKYHWKFWGMFILASTHLFFVFFLIPGIYSAKLTTFFRFPAYYVLRKIDIGGILNNAENFLSAHWFCDNFILIIMSLYFLSRYLRFIFKNIKEKNINIIIIIFGIIAIAISKLKLSDPYTLINFMKKDFSIFVFLPIFGILLISSILIFFKRKKKNTN